MIELDLESDVDFTSSEPIYDFYVAGPFFTDDQMKSMERLERVLHDRKQSTFLPRFASSLKKDGAEEVFKKNLQGMHLSRAVIVNVVDNDPGTMFDMGYAFAHNIPVYVYAEGLKPGDKMNLMLSRGAKAIITSPADLEAFLDSGELASVSITEY
ncbi:nucleoside deoxyribosyltransferase [Bifidobacterium dolichotidis]|uniref:Nucleoside deoxyribosyltransferase n=1 Tax=Bifidobacterium dolichotidis TaxID=2306976 RepID=A0A430FSK1_9BIFI|nr:nucleoside 2-deoxyribosyltransferase [Bifidobacterium dolichotidis]RSX55843.1 nucleoside deoxyribosyltransferase [Bifidobacterium dolichotidis]